MQKSWPFRNEYHTPYLLWSFQVYILFGLELVERKDTSHQAPPKGYDVFFGKTIKSPHVTNTLNVAYRTCRSSR